MLSPDSELIFDATHYADVAYAGDTSAPQCPQSLIRSSVLCCGQGAGMPVRSAWIINDND